VIWTATEEETGTIPYYNGLENGPGNRYILVFGVNEYSEYSSIAVDCLSSESPHN
jgi:hypothetical protein